MHVHIYIYNVCMDIYIYIYIYIYTISLLKHHTTTHKAACCRNIEIVLHPTILSYIYTYIYMHIGRGTVLNLVLSPITAGIQSLVIFYALLAPLNFTKQDCFGTNVV